MCKENLYAKMEKLEAQICRSTRQGLKVMPCPVPCPNPMEANDVMSEELRLQRNAPGP